MWESEGRAGTAGGEPGTDGRAIRVSGILRAEIFARLFKQRHRMEKQYYIP